MGVGIAAGPHCRRCWHSDYPEPELTASFRRSLPFGPHPCGGNPHGPALHFGILPQAGSSFVPSRSVLRRPQFLTTWAWQALVPLPQFARCRAPCRRVRVSLPDPEAPLPSARPRGFAFGRISPGGKGSVVLPGAPPPRPLPPNRVSSLWGPHLCRNRLASGRRFGIRNRFFEVAILHSQSAPQHAESGLNATFPSRFD